MYLHNFKLKIMKKRYQKDGNAYLTFKNASFQSPELWPVCAHFAHTIELQYISGFCPAKPAPLAKFWLCTGSECGSDTLGRDPV